MIAPEAGLSVTRQCALFGVARSSFYYRPRPESVEELELLKRLDRIFTDHPVYGSRRLQVALLREGVSIGRRRVRRLMRKLGLWAVRLRETRFRNLPDGFSLRPGMRVVADIKVGRRPILDYVLNPITRVINEACANPELYLSTGLTREYRRDHLFCDGLKDVTIVNGMARLEFHRLEVVERGGNRELRPVSEFTVALPVQGL